MTDRSFGQFTGPSVSFGYEHNVTTVQLARAFLRLLTGEQRELRLVTAIEKDGETVRPGSVARPETRFLSEDTIQKVRAAMVDVVSDDKHATGRHLHEILAKQGVEQPLIAGKTGTSDSPIGNIRAKTAAFVGYAPANAPRFLCVCVLRKDRAVRFYGGSYAAPPAGRLLLEALAQRPPVRSPSKQVRVWSGVRGLSSSKSKSGGQ